METNDKIIRLKLSDRLTVDIQKNWGGWDMVVDIYGKYNTSDSVERLKSEWADAVVVHKYLNDEGWISDEHPLNILESFKDYSLLNPTASTPEPAVAEEEGWKDSYSDDEPKDWEWFMKDSVDLTEMNNGYDGRPTRLEVSPFSNEIHEKPGVYLQHVEGCGYNVYELSPEQALELAELLIRAAKQTKKDFFFHDTTKKIS